MTPAGKMTMNNGRLVENFIAESPHLSLVESNVFDIPRRIRSMIPLTLSFGTTGEASLKFTT